KKNAHPIGVSVTHDDQLTVASHSTGSKQRACHIQSGINLSSCEHDKSNDDLYKQYRTEGAAMPISK
ncbi:hypothetical protein, partial [Paenibacillus campinasensis]|uniref:hypothetical protein n=1 Tax=Paenibacillus campinasensis TaxID=66347 RepID=UPI001C532499